MPKRTKATLKYDKDIYSYSTLKLAQPLTEKEVRQEYSRLRSIAQKRLKRFQGTEWEDTQIYKYNKDNFPKMKDIKSKDEIYHRLSLVANFITSSRSTISGLKRERKETINTLQERGYTYINNKNFKDFTEFMETIRTEKIAQIYDSKRIAELFNVAQKKKIPVDEIKKDFSSWMKNKEKLEKLKLTKNKNDITANDYRKALKIKIPK